MRRNRIKTTARSLARSVASPVSGSGGGTPDPFWITQPEDAVVEVGEDAEFAFEAGGTEPIVYNVWEWK